MRRTKFSEKEMELLNGLMELADNIRTRDMINEAAKKVGAPIDESPVAEVLTKIGHITMVGVLAKMYNEKDPE